MPQLCPTYRSSRSIRTLPSGELTAAAQRQQAALPAN